MWYMQGFFFLNKSLGLNYSHTVSFLTLYAKEAF